MATTETQNISKQHSGKNQHWAEKWAVAEKRSTDFCGLQLKTAHATHTATSRATRTAHSKHSKRSYALFLRFANINAAEQHYEQRVGRFTASCLRYQCGFLTTATQHTAVNTYEQEIRKNCSNRVNH